tara:strand:- start:158 stop:889 length:732 start_codon:yes stop_codon:yes gene_type:complete
MPFEVRNVNIHDLRPQLLSTSVSASSPFKFRLYPISEEAFKIASQLLHSITFWDIDATPHKIVGNMVLSKMARHKNTLKDIDEGIDGASENQEEEEVEVGVDGSKQRDATTSDCEYYYSGDVTVHIDCTVCLSLGSAVENVQKLPSLLMKVTPRTGISSKSVRLASASSTSSSASSSASPSRVSVIKNAVGMGENASEAGGVVVEAGREEITHTLMQLLTGESEPNRGDNAMKLEVFLISAKS